MKTYTKTGQTTRPLSPVVIVFLGILIVSTASIFIRFAQKEASSIVIAAYRLTLAALILLPVALTRHRDELRALTRKQILLAVLSGVFLAIHFATWISSLAFTTVASSAVLVSTTPLWVAMFSPIFLHERPSRIVAVGLAVALLGGALVGMSESCTLRVSGIVCPPASVFLQAGAFTGNLLALAGALAAAAYLLAGRFLRPTMSLVVYIFTVYGIAAVVLVGMALASGQPLVHFSWTIYLCFLALAVGPQLLGHTSFNYGLRYLSAAFVSVVLLGEPIGSTILALIILKENPSLMEVVGGVVILIGLYLASRAQQNPQQKAEAAEDLA